jgi:hypothetical protein
VYDRHGLEPEGFVSPFDVIDTRREWFLTEKGNKRQPLGQLLPDGQLVEIRAGVPPVNTHSSNISGLNGGRDLLLVGEESRNVNPNRIVRAGGAPLELTS